MKKQADKDTSVKVYGDQGASWWRTGPGPPFLKCSKAIKWKLKFIATEMFLVLETTFPLRLQLFGFVPPLPGKRFVTTTE